ncbi:MAG: Oxidoreductase [Candidatus Yanofskybacteria bacterium GW2011_GWF1_44_227]|uniref:Oxidoreductase n=1 Tax=Candidatus Yanofskybacteria bacterium GW2011_GWE2_40_11 TaxID=1619033 RepID=A0A0G0QUY4_9BACT|nr:MAG: Oxidoreductase [Candidatus Yanofskybacteria bacterium GW2011_GWE1_40_10]KKR41166.1 MAG: Oxidoreductase [Candidatus Yanofskybacteria bacterium GW2011_GWE2_40_11]KKT15837.1 MAG: Oxidoreductase [Candidatus Yanofskybacteria bacterium GW2011_GWF2_43_596]KKT53650.1 MAG: Oxidoreductase [Candidatus Yanofskybacteria bacterium GW2011_GWF1_44_227]
MDSNISLAMGRLAGLVLVYSLLLQLVLIGRTGWLEKIFGMDKLARFHHWNGVGTLVMLLAHPILLTVAKSGDSGFVATFIRLNGGDDVLNGTIAAIIIIAVGILIPILLEKLKYEIWYYLHLLLYVAILLAFGHQLELGGDFRDNGLFVVFWWVLYVFAFGNLILYRFARPIYYFWRHSFEIQKVEKDTEESHSIYIQGKDLKRFEFKGGQFAIFRFLQEGFWYEAHPYSFSSIHNDKFLRITVKNLGDYSNKIRELKVGTKVIIDGPNGVFTTARAGNRKILLIAGGVGITPVKAVAEEMIKDNMDVALIYSNRQEGNIVLEKEVDLLAAEYKNLRLIKFLSQKMGQLDPEKIKALVQDYKERTVYICGPIPMIESLVSGLKAAGLRGSNIIFEKFSLR